MKVNNLKSSLIFLFILILPTIISAQETENWTKVLSPKGDFAALLPPEFLVDNEDDEYRAYAFQDEVKINIQITESGQAKNRLALMRKFQSQTEANIFSFAVGSFIGDVHTDQTEKSYSVSVYMASPKAFYVIWAAADDKKNQVLKKFLHSIRLDNQPLVKQDNPIKLDAVSGVSIASLKTSPIILEALKKKKGEKVEIKYAPENENEPGKTEDTAKYSRPLVILRKPKPGYTTGAREDGVEGKVRLRVLFRADGQIGEITVLKELKNGLTKQAADAARRIKFLPAEIDGKPADVTRTVEFNFNIY